MGFFKKTINYAKKLKFNKRLIIKILNPNNISDKIFYLRNAEENLFSFCSKIVNTNPKHIEDYYNESVKNVLSNEEYHKILYIITRILKPKIFVETGVNEGSSSQAILIAMKKNNYGKLYSIDLPDLKNLEDSTSYDLNDKELGFLVPKNLRDRWELIIGDSKNLLNSLLLESKEIDIFLHDSLHTYNHMKFEFNESWPFIRKKGLLLSHDVQWNHAFREFSKNKDFHVFRYNVGAVVKN